MRALAATLPLTLALALACGGGGTPAPPTPAATPAATTGTAAEAPREAAKPTKAADEGPVVADHWLVILGSKRDPNEAIPGLATLRSHPEVAAKPGTLLSSRYKNLMPCYTVTYADASTDKAAALALSKQLKGLGIDNYVKNAGAFVGPSAAIDAFCAGGPDEVQTSFEILAEADGRLWLPVYLPDSVAESTLQGAPAPRATDQEYDTWIQPLAVEGLGDVKKGATYHAVDAMTGRALTCTVESFAGLTLGTPHFGVLQQESPPRSPACGSAALYAALSCDGDVGSGAAWVAAPAGGKPLAAYTRVGEGSPAMVKAAEAALTSETDWDATPDNPEEGEVERTATVTVFRGPNGNVALVEGSLSVGGVCGGEQTTWSAVYAVNGDALGAPVGKFVSEQFTDSAGLIDVEGDGKPERVVRSFPQDTKVVDTDGAEAAGMSIAYCDCPC